MKSWSLYNREEKLRIDDLTIDQIKLILLSISARRLPEWYLCQAGDLSWKPLSEVMDLFNEAPANEVPSVSSKTQSRPDIGARTKTAKTKSKTKVKAPKPVPLTALDAANIPTLKDLIVDKAQTQERRSARRYARRLIFEVTRGEKVFTCRTVDISMNGLSLREPLPSWIPRSFSANLKFNQYSISIQCERVSEQQLRITAAESWALIRQWIVSW